ncbi:hypothetical protein Tsubulata_022701 [Turnera subulata]|uniref:Uncharacterized protein n=1 Tax=Turnera subulata TaxID=218843 RepID=A0A9Q0F171_9ROSI|nr:hypothetical protein Tsubulata_022701 [Turnera subulata]
MSEELGPPRGLKNGAVMELLKAMEREEILEVFSSPPSVYPPTTLRLFLWRSLASHPQAH